MRFFLLFKPPTARLEQGTVLPFLIGIVVLLRAGKPPDPLLRSEMATPFAGFCILVAFTI